MQMGKLLVQILKNVLKKVPIWQNKNSHKQFMKLTWNTETTLIHKKQWRIFLITFSKSVEQEGTLSFKWYSTLCSLSSHSWFRWVLIHLSSRQKEKDKLKKKWMHYMQPSSNGAWVALCLPMLRCLWLNVSR